VSRILGSVGPRLLFVGNDGVTGDELWSIDTAGIVAQVADLTPGTGSSGFTAGSRSFQPVGERGYFTADTTREGRLYVTDGTPGGTSEIDPQVVAGRGSLYLAGDRLFYAGLYGAGDNGGEPWWLDLFAYAGTSTCSTPHAPIHDGTGVPGNDTIVIAADVPIADLELSLDIEHTYVSDLDLTLTHVNTGTSVAVLAGSQDCGGNDMQITLSDRAAAPAAANCEAGEAWPRFSRWRPSAPLSPFSGESTTGTWRLSVADNLPVFGGVLHSWCLHFQPGIFADGFESGDPTAWSSSVP
jgi:ELWxxDGT repeat protein